MSFPDLLYIKYDRKVIQQVVELRPSWIREKVFLEMFRITRKDDFLVVTYYNVEGYALRTTFDFLATIIKICPEYQIVDANTLRKN